MAALGRIAPSSLTSPGSRRRRRRLDVVDVVLDQADAVQSLDRVRQLLERLDQVLAIGLLLEHDPDLGELAREELGLGQRAGVGLAVALDLLLVAVGLAVLREQDQRRGVRGLSREQQVQQDERIRVKGSSCPSSQAALTAIQMMTKIVCTAR